MFCPKCGTQLEDTAAFCPKCGTQMARAGQAQQQPQPQPQPQPQQVPPQPQYQQAPQQVPPQYQHAPQKPKSVNPMFANMIKSLKAFLTPKPQNAISVASKSNSIEWIFYAVAAIIFFAISLPIVVRGYIGGAIGGAMKDAAAGLGAFGGTAKSFIGEAVKEAKNTLFNFPGGMGASFLVGAIAYFSLSGSTFLFSKVVLKNNVSLNQVFNAIGVATLPLTAVIIANIIFGLIWAPLAIVLYIIALLLTIALSYEAYKALTNNGSILFYIAILAITVILTMFFADILYTAVVKAGVGDLASSLGSLF